MFVVFELALNIFLHIFSDVPSESVVCLMRVSRGFVKTLYMKMFWICFMQNTWLLTNIRMKLKGQNVINDRL